MKLHPSYLSTDLILRLPLPTLLNFFTLTLLPSMIRFPLYLLFVYNAQQQFPERKSYRFYISIWVQIFNSKNSDQKG